MNERAVAARREYFREYARTHRKELRAAQERYWMRRAERMEQEKQQRRQKARESSNAREQD